MVTIGFVQVVGPRTIARRCLINRFDDDVKSAPRPTLAEVADELKVRTNYGRASLRRYGQYLTRWRDDQIALLELRNGDGAYAGDTQRMWSRFLPRATVVGLASDLRARGGDGKRVHRVVGTPEATGLLVDLVTTYGPFTAVVDEGAAIDHVADLFAALLPGGVYLLELDGVGLDLATVSALVAGLPAGQVAAVHLFDHLVVLERADDQSRAAEARALLRDTLRRGIPLPPQRLRFLVDDDDAGLVVHAEDLVQRSRRHGLQEGARVLDIGCGYGRLALGLKMADFTGAYVGFDILPRHIQWCRDHLATADGRYAFEHFDVRNGRYNPDGTIEPEDASFPVGDGEADFCTAYSVFTHMYVADQRRYLAEIAQVLSPGGLAVATWFLFDDERLPLATSSASEYPMVHVLDEDCRYAYADDPLHAISYRQSFVEAMVDEAGLEIRSLERGTWAGEPGSTLQDHLVLARKG